MLFLLKKRSDIAFAVLMVLLINISGVLNWPLLSVITISIVALGLIVFSLLYYKEFLLYSLCFFIPLTISIPITGNTRLNVPSELICAILAIYLGFRMALNYKIERKLLFHPIPILIIADLAWMFITSCTSSMPEVSLKRFVVRLVYVMVYLVLFFELFKIRKNNILKVCILHCVGLIVPILFTFIHHSVSGFSTLGATKASLPFYNDHTIYGAVLVFFIPFLVYYTFIHKQPIVYRTFLFSLLLLFIAAAFLSYSRAAWVSLLVAAVVYIVIRIRPKKIYIISSLLVLAIAGFLMRDPIVNSLSSNKEVSLKEDLATHLRSVTNVRTDVSNTERLNRWKCAWKMFLDKPLLGFGPGTYQFFYGAYQNRKDITVISTFSGNKGHAHSEYLNYLCEEGLPGFLIFFTLLIMVCYRAVKLIYRQNNKQLKNISIVIFLGLITFFVHSFFNGFIETDKMAMPFFVSLAAIISLDVSSENTIGG